MPAHSFVWYELVTSDTSAAQAFYRAVVGWEAQPFSGGETPYTVVNARGKGVGGLMPLPDGMSTPFWMGYVGVPDRDAAVARWKGAGGAVHRTFEIPTVGRIALVTDPQQVGLAMIQGASDQPSEAFQAGVPGHGGWHELHTTDARAAYDFYAHQFGWTKGEAFEMGPMGTYQLFQVGDQAIGGMMNSPDFPRPSWLYYFGVDGIDAALARVTASGGRVLHGPSEVPGGQFILQAQDPQGAMFALVGPR